MGGILNAVMAAGVPGNGPMHREFSDFVKDLGACVQKNSKAYEDLTSMFLYGSAERSACASQAVKLGSSSREFAHCMSSFLSDPDRIERVRDVLVEKKELRSRARNFAGLSSTEKAKVMSSLFTRSVIEDEREGGELSGMSLAVLAALVCEVEGNHGPAEFVAAALSK
jgi:putative ubiquitin-RnfH superfamily antitoxin RatB of RatAB toxin-antitoxin module